MWKSLWKGQIILLVLALMAALRVAQWEQQTENKKAWNLGQGVDGFLVNQLDTLFLLEGAGETLREVDSSRVWRRELW